MSNRTAWHRICYCRLYLTTRDSYLASVDAIRLALEVFTTDTLGKKVSRWLISTVAQLVRVCV